MEDSCPIPASTLGNILTLVAGFSWHSYFHDVGTAVVHASSKAWRFWHFPGACPRPRKRWAGSQAAPEPVSRNLLIHTSEIASTPPSAL
jgi:hypothetical protein